MAFTPLSEVHFSDQTEMLSIYANVLLLCNRGIYKTWLFRRLCTYHMAAFTLQPIFKGWLRSGARAWCAQAATQKREG